MNHKGTVTLETERLILQRFTMDDVEAMFRNWEMKLHRVDLEVLEYNNRAIHCYEKCGFKIDGILRESAIK